MRSLLWAVLLISISCLVRAADDPSLLKDLATKAQSVEQQYRREEKKLQDVDEEIFRIQDKIARLKKDIASKQERRKYLEGELDRSEAALDGHQERVRGNWISLYKGSFLDMVDIWYSHEEYTGYLGSILQHNEEILKEYAEMRSGIEQSRQRLDAATVQLKQDLGELEDTGQELQGQRNKKEKMLASLRRESESCQDKMRKLMEKIAARKREKELTSADIFKKRGALPWPVKGEVVRGFGTFEVKGIAQRSQGVDIKAREGDPVRSIYGGTVVFINWMSGYGNTIILDHGGGYYSVYGHIQKAVKTLGDRVSALETIALVGQSGAVLEPTLHFELRFRDKPQDPGVWLARE